MSKKFLIVLGIIAAIIFTSAVTYALNSNIVNKKSKPSDYKIGIKYSEALNKDRPMVALFYADWCGYCMRFMPVFKSLEEKNKSKYNFVMLNVEDYSYQTIVNDVALTGYPTVYIIDPKYNNRFLLNNAIYMNMPKFQVELDRYTKIRGMLDSTATCSK